MCRIFRAGNNYIAALTMPAQDDLCAALPIFSGQFGKQRLLLKRLIAMSQGVPCLDYDSLFIQEPFQFFFLRVRVRFCLQDGKLRFNPDSGRPAILAHPLHSRWRRNDGLPANYQCPPFLPAARRFAPARNWRKCRKGSPSYR